MTIAEQTQTVVLTTLMDFYDTRVDDVAEVVAARLLAHGLLQEDICGATSGRTDPLTCLMPIEHEGWHKGLGSTWSS
jgi:hypothetical protein